MFSCEFCEISKNNFFAEHLWVTVSETPNVPSNIKKIQMNLQTSVPPENSPVFIFNF